MIRKFGGNSRIVGDKIEVADQVHIGQNVSIKGKHIVLANGVNIGDAVNIEADIVNLGYRTVIDEKCKIVCSSKNEGLSIGDHCLIGNNSVILVPTLKMGDYCKLHNHLFMNGNMPCTIGHNVWAGNNCILNCADELIIGNGVGFGTYTSVWTHGYHGELLEGCVLHNKAPVKICDGAWILGSYNVISPGVTIGENAVVLTGSIVTKDVPPFGCVAGVPARDVSDKIKTYKPMTLEEKFLMMKGFIETFISQFDTECVIQIENGWRINHDLIKGQILLIPETEDQHLNVDRPTAIFTKVNNTTESCGDITIFDLKSKQYTKRMSEIEIAIIKFLLYDKARFIPAP